MGGTLTRLRHMILRIPEMRLLMQGLDGAGKTTILYKLKLGEVVTTIPTIGFNVENVELNNASLTVWDCGGRSKSRLLWRHFMAGTDGLIWVVDSTDRERLDSDSDYDFSSSRVELHKGLLEEELRDAVVLVLATKQDVAGAMTPAEITERMGLNAIKSHPWHVQGCCGKTGEGLFEGLQWLTEAVKQQSKLKPKAPRPPAPVAIAQPVEKVVTRLNPPPASQRRKLDAISSNNPNVLAVKGDEDVLLSPAPAADPAPAAITPGGPAAVPTAPPLAVA